MTIDAASPNAPVTSADRAAVVAVAIGVSVVGLSVFLALPVMLGALADHYRLDDAQIGYLGSAELAGIAASSMTVSAVLTRFRTSSLCAFGLILMVAGALITSLSVPFVVLAGSRLIGGFGGGLCYSSCLAFIGGMKHAERKYSVLIFLQVLVTGIELYCFPRLGLRGMFWAVAALGTLALAVVGLLRAPPAHAQTSAGRAMAIPRERLPGIALVLGAVLVFYVMIGSVWSYLERIGTSLGYSQVTVGEALSYGNFLSLLGCAAAYLLSRRFGVRVPLLVALAAMSLSLLMMASSLTPITYLVGLAVFFLLWNFVDIYQLGVLSALDPSTRAPALVPAAQGVGLTIGPALSGMWLVSAGTKHHYANVLWLGGGCTLIALLLSAGAHVRGRGAIRTCINAASR